MNKKVKLAHEVYIRTGIPFYIGRQEIGNDEMGYGINLFLFFKISDLSPAHLRYFGQRKLSFVKSVELGVIEIDIDEDSVDLNNYIECYSSEHGKIYTNDLQHREPLRKGKSRQKV